MLPLPKPELVLTATSTSSAWLASLAAGCRLAADGNPLTTHSVSKNCFTFHSTNIRSFLETSISTQSIYIINLPDTVMTGGAYDRGRTSTIGQHSQVFVAVGGRLAAAAAAV